MKKEWTETIITKISLAMYVPSNTGKHIHNDRPYHGFVLNDENSVKDYVFEEGYVLHTYEKSLFYLPKSSSYHVVEINPGGCYAINFDADICDEPFCVKTKSNELLKKDFKLACEEWRIRDLTSQAAAMRALYNSIYLLQKEQKQSYMPNERHRIILPAIESIEHDLADPELTVESLAALCKISEVYFRKIFLHEFGVSPKEYIIQKRMKYALELLALGEFEVSQVATLCGYSEPCHFSREFKKRFGVAPKNYT